MMTDISLCLLEVTCSQRPVFPMFMELCSCYIFNTAFQMMNESQGDLSFLNDSDHQVLAPIATQQPFHKNPVFDTQRQTQRTTNAVLNVLAPNRSTNKLEFNDQLIDYLAADDGNSNLNIVTFLGPRQVGKSFLVDFLISKEEKSVSRLLSKNPRPHINMPTYEVRGKNGEKVVLFDSNEELSNESFLWAYFLSSMFVLNLPQGDKKAEEHFLSKLDHVRISLQSEQDELSLPQLIILRRDAQTKEFQDRDFLSRVEGYGLFASDIATLSMAYPGSSSVNSKDIRDVGQNLMSEAFVNDATNLSWAIKSGRPKAIKGNYIGSKIAGLALEPVTQSINKTGKVQTGKIWGDVIETLSVGYYNYYMKKYSEELERQFSNEQPCDKYSLYKRLSRIRRNTDKKFEGFNMIAGDATFERYRSKLQDNIGKKERIIREINKRKSIEKNDELCKKLFGQMNDSNCDALIQQYCQSKLDDNKTEVLLNNFETVIKTRLADVERSKNPALKPSTEIVKLENQLRDLEAKVEGEKRNKVELVNFDEEKVRATIAEKEREVGELEAELEKQRKVSSEKKANQNKDIIELENKIDSLRSVTKQQDVEIDKLRAAKNAEADQTIKELERRLREENDKYQRLQGQVKKAQELSSVGKRQTKPSSKDTCCLIM